MRNDERESAMPPSLGYRVDHLGLRLPGQVLRLDLYRLICYFHSSHYLATLSDGEDFCPWQALRFEFQDQEVMRILLQTAVAVRFTGCGHADPLRVDRAWLEDPVGRLYKSVRQEQSEPLSVRESCNKIIHARYIVPDNNGRRNPCERVIKPTVFCYEDAEQQTGWKAEIDLLLFAEAADGLFQLF